MYQAEILTKDEAGELLTIARRTLENFVRHESVAKPESHSEKLDQIYGLSCILHGPGGTVGEAAMGIPHPVLSIIDAVIAAVTHAARDVTADMLHEIKIELTIMTTPQLLDYMHPAEKYFNHIVPEADGLLLRYGMYEAFLTPQAWSGQPKEKFMEELCAKAGLSEGMWKEEGIELYKFSVQVVRES